MDDRDASPAEAGAVEDSGVVDASAPVDAAPDAPEPVSVICGDGIRGLDEECDDGNGNESDFCTSSCIVLDRTALPLDGAGTPATRRRELAGGSHVVAGTRRSAVVLYADNTVSPKALSAALFRTDGTRVVESGIPFTGEYQPFEPSEAAVAPLPGDRYALVWTARNVDGDGLGVGIRELDGATGTLAPIQQANTYNFGAQQTVDAVWTGSELVVSWVDRSEGVASRVRARRFDRYLVPLADEEAIAPSSGAQSERELVIAPFAGSYAALWIESYASLPSVIRVWGNGTDWTIPVLGAFTTDMMRLAALDDRHLLAVWTQSDFDVSSGMEVPHLYAAVLSVEAPEDVEPVRIDALSTALGADPARRMRTPALAVAGSSAFLSWLADTSFGGDGEPALVIKEMPWRVGTDGAFALDLTLEESPLPRTEPRRSSGGQDAPALGVVPWTPGGALLAAWEDDARTFGAEQRRPDVIAQLVPVPVLLSGGGN